MLRMIIGVVLGVVASLAVISMFANIANHLFLPSINWFLVLLMGWVFASFVASALATLVARHGRIPGLVAGAFPLAVVIGASIMLAFPHWVLIAAGPTQILVTIAAAVLFDHKQA